MKVCPLCDRVMDETGITHRHIGEGRILCGYRSKAFAEIEARAAGRAEIRLSRLLEALDHHLQMEDVEVEVRTSRGWTTVRQLLLRRL